MCGYVSWVVLRGKINGEMREFAQRLDDKVVFDAIGIKFRERTLIDVKVAGKGSLGFATAFLFASHRLDEFMIVGHCFSMPYLTEIKLNKPWLVGGIHPGLVIILRQQLH